MAKRNNIYYNSANLFILLALFVASCARMGTPDGGAYDETPPVVLRTNPAIGALNNDKKRIVLEFDEYVKLQNASEKIIISPPQIEIGRNTLS